MTWLPLLILGLVSLIGGVASTVATNSSNSSAVNAANTANKEMNAENNRVLQQESAKSLYNSLPTTQVRNMVAAGMSKYGALAALDSGGSYIPAPVVSARNEAAKYDFSGIGSAMSDLSGLGSQLNTTRMQIEAQERMNAATNDTNLEIARLNAQANRSNIEDTNFTNLVDASERAKYSSLVQSLQKYIQDAPKDKMSYYGIRSIIPDSLRSEMDSLSPASQRVLGEWISSQGAASSEARKTEYNESSLEAVSRRQVAEAAKAETEKEISDIDKRIRLIEEKAAGSRSSREKEELEAAKARRKLLEEDAKLAEKLSSKKLEELDQNIKNAKQKADIEALRADMDVVQRRIDILVSISNMKAYGFFSGLEIGKARDDLQEELKSLQSRYNAKIKELYKYAE